MTHRVGPSYRLEFALAAAILAALAFWARDDLRAWMASWSAAAPLSVRIDCRAPAEGEYLYVAVRRDRDGRHVGDCFYATSRGAARMGAR